MKKNTKTKKDLLMEIEKLRAELDGAKKSLLAALQDKKAGPQINESSEIEEALKVTERKYREFVQHVPAGIYAIDFRNKRFTTVNEAMCQMLGYSREELLAMNPFDIMDEDGRARFQDRIDKWLNGEKPDRNVEFKVKTKDGRTIDVVLDVTFTRDKEGKPLGAMVVGHDVTQRKKTEAALARQNELLQHIFDSIPVQLVMWDPRLRRFTLNRHAQEVLGWTNDDANQGDFMAKVYPDEAYRAEVAAYMQSLESGWREWSCTTKDGRNIPCDWANIRLTDDTMIGIGVDLRERKRAEAAIKKSEEALLKSRAELEEKVRQRTAELAKANELLERMFSSVDLAIAYMDKDFNFIRVNRAYAEADGRKPEFYVGKNHFILYPNKENEKIFRRVVKTGKPYSVYAKPFVYAKNPERGTTYWDWSVQPVKDPNHKVGSIVLSLVDVTERIEAEESVRLNEALLRTVFETLPVGVWLADKEGHITHGNPEGRRIWGGAKYVGID